MLITKFDLYRTEWLDLVFTNRNKNYGAYELRQTYASTLLKSMGIGFFGVGAALAIVLYAARPAIEQAVSIVEPKDKETPVNITKIKPPVKVEPPVEITTPAAAPVTPAAAAPRVKTNAIPTEVVADDLPTVDPPKISELTAAIGPQNQDGITGVENLSGANGTGDATAKGMGTGMGEGAGTDNGVYNFNAIEVLPEPVGGAQAWSKFLQKHLRYPAVAEREGLNGRVLISFIVEKDGKLTDFKVDRGAGFGFDEEALRVLKMAPAWRPGIQNGRPVRVKYTIPINFRAPE
ncbi:energy transducer TonB [Mucilaginibacter hurinus]|uniref:Energy transducer TonB n=1 Tax=Mucilaginibacter hurinus TaxID=2201324 RepID=A0A367GNL4_9SPHI|nr:energy transducer TonB [Mucilaginibacter hurinus]RCH55082.1 energy transducer TonB [Mucilaginibacter hurinus]